jgi:hypothetical protein
VLPFGYEGIFGREPPATELIDDPALSPAHARIVRNHDGIVVADLASASGTFLNGERVTQPSAVRDGDTINFGRVTAVLRRPPPVHGPLRPETPIAGRLEPSERPAPSDAAPERALSRSGRDVLLNGIVLNVTPPAQGNPTLVLDMRTDGGETVTVHLRLWNPFRIPSVTAGHRVRIAGRWSRHGFLNPRSIENETTETRWERSRGGGVALVLVLLVLALVLALLLV